MDKAGTEGMEMYGYVMKKGGQRMHFIKFFILIGLSLVIGFFGCTKEQKAEAPKQEQIIKHLVPPKAEIKGETFLVELSDLKVDMFAYITSKEIVGTPGLKGRIKITNKSKNALDIQAVTLEYLDEAGKPIPFKPEERIGKVNPFWETLQPEGTTEGSLDVTIPKDAMKGTPLRKIEVKLVYDPSPLKRESLTLSEKVE